MPFRRGHRLDLASFGLFVAGLLVALCVFSYDPADPPAAEVYPPHESPANLLGTPGAWLARLLHDTLGVAAYVLLGGWFVLVLVLFLRRRFRVWCFRLAGWLILLPVAAVLGDYFAADLANQSVAGGGGTLGAWLSTWLEERLTAGGRNLAVAGASLAGLALAFNFVLGPLARAACFVSRLPVRWRAAWSAVPTALRGHEAASCPPTAAGTALTEPVQLAEPSAREEKPVARKLQPVGADNPIPIKHPEPVAEPEPPPPAARPMVPISRPVPVPSDEERFADYELPPQALLEDPQPFPYEQHDQRLRDTAALLEQTFKDFGVNVRVVGINTGPVVTQFEVALETGLRVHKVTGLSDELALNLKVPSVRMVAPIPGKNTVGVEVPNEHRAVVRLKEVLRTCGGKAAKFRIPLYLGKDTEGRPLVCDLAEMPHLLIAGRTGTGKSVCMNAIILSILMTRRPDEVKMIMIDPKMLELSEYGRIPHLMHPVVKDMKKAEAILSWAVDKMEERYDLLSRARVRSIAGYNDLPPTELHRRLGTNEMSEEERAQIPDKIPYIVIFVDEMNDLMMMMKKEVEGHVIRLAQKSRAAGIHLVVATQKPTVDVITGLIKSNLPARICFQVSSRSDSRVVLDEMGADKLLGKGDMLFLAPGTSTLVRAQGTYASDEEITRVVEHLQCDPCYAPELIQLNTAGEDGPGGTLERLRARDELYEQAIEVIVREGRGSVSLLQRALGIGYGRAARLIDFMAEDGIVGNYNGSQAREVLYTPEQWTALKDNREAG